MSIGTRLRVFILQRRIRRWMARREYYRECRREIEALMAACSENEWRARQELIQLTHRAQLARLAVGNTDSAS